MARSTLAILDDAHDAEVHQDQRPSFGNNVIAEHISQKEKEPDKDQEHGTAWQSPAGRAKARRPRGIRQTERIRRGRSSLFSVSYSNRVDDLIDVPERDRQSEDGFQPSTKVAQGEDKSG